MERPLQQMTSVRLYITGSTENAQKILRQTPDGLGIWKNTQFYINEGDEPCDYLVVFTHYSKIIRTSVPKERRIFIAGEPPQMKHYPESFLAQFGTVISSHESIQHPNAYIEQQGYIWFSGMQFNDDKTRTITHTYDDYKKEGSIKKTKTLSVICSDKCSKSGHKQRFEFVKNLKEALGDELDLFGKGQNPIPNKSDAIRPYKYHITIENGSAPHYWSEKLADCYLDEAYPFYAGCPEMGDYFPKEAYTRINLDDVEGTIATIRKAIKEDWHSNAQPAIREAKKRVLNDYNMFNLITQHIGRIAATTTTELTKEDKLYPRKYFKKGPKASLKRIWGKLRP